MSDETTLLLCPFCGGEAHVVSDYSSERDETRWNLWHECNGHEGESVGYGHSLHPWFDTPWYKTEAEAIAAWNTRAPVEYDGWFYLPKPKESIVQYGAPRIEEVEHGYKVTQSVEVIESAIRLWGDELGEYTKKRICETWNTRATHGTLTAEQVREAIENHGTASLGCRWQFTDRNLQAIADELNAVIGGKVDR